MIREYKPEDIDAIIRLLDKHSQLSEIEKEEKRDELLDTGRVLVYEDQGQVLGICSLSFWNNSELGRCGEAIFSVEENQPRWIADLLWKGAMAVCEEEGVRCLMTHCDQTHSQWGEFFCEVGFEHWFGLEQMIYCGGHRPQTDLSFRTYQESDFHAYHTALGQCFAPMRQANDIRPHNLFDNPSVERQERLREVANGLKDSIFLFYDGEQWVGSSMIKQEEIDDLFVLPELQGQGYGRRIMEATINMAFDRQCEKITLSVVAWNQHAIRLYQDLGFKKTQRSEHYRLFL